MDENASYYAVIPSFILLHKELSHAEKLLYAHILTLVKVGGSCYASNQYFADALGASDRTVSRWINNLRDIGLIDYKITYKDGNRGVDKRFIWLKKYGRQNCHLPDTGDGRGVDTDGDIIDKSINNKKNIQKKTVFTPPTLDEVRTHIEEKGYNIDPEYFIEYYESNDWKNNNGKKVKSWKQTLVTWNRNNQSKQKASKADPADLAEQYFKEITGG